MISEVRCILNLFNLLKSVQNFELFYSCSFYNHKLVVFYLDFMWKKPVCNSEVKEKLVKIAYK